MINNRKSGKSLILLAIVIVVMSIVLFFVTRIFDQKTYKATEEAFKLNVYEYNIELEEYKTQLEFTEGYNEANVNAVGVKMRQIIPNMQETDMTKFKVESGELVYIGTDSNEQKWTKEVKI